MIDLNDVIADLEAKLDVLRPLREGAEDLGSIDDLREDTKAECRGAVRAYQGMIDTLETLKRGCAATLELGYPDIPEKRQVSAEIEADIRANLASVTRVAQEFFAPVAEKAEIVLGPGHPTPH